MRILVPNQDGGAPSKVVLNDLDSASDSVLFTDLLAERGRTAAHLSTNGSANRIGEFIFGEARRRNWSGGHAQFEQPFPPERVNTENRHRNIRESRPQRRSRDSGSTLMDGRGYVLEQPGVRREVYAKNFVGELSGVHPGSARHQDAALPGPC
jgi:hypothetical protein